MKKRFLLIFALGVWAGCASGSRNSAGSEVTNLSALEFSNASSVAIAGVKGESKAAEAFRGYRRVTAWRTPDRTTTTELAALMSEIIRGDLTAERQPLKPGEDRVRLHSFCFNPGYAVRLKSDHGSRDFLVCLECDEMYVFDDAGHLWNHHLEKIEAAKLAMLLGGA